MQCVGILQNCLALLALVVSQRRTFHNFCYYFIGLRQVLLLDKFHSLFKELLFVFFLGENNLQTFEYRVEELPSIAIFSLHRRLSHFYGDLMHVIEPMSEGTKLGIAAVSIHEVLTKQGRTLQSVVLYMDTGSICSGTTLGNGSVLRLS